jgi:hypothetical protein
MMKGEPKAVKVVDFDRIDFGRVVRVERPPAVEGPRRLLFVAVDNDGGAVEAVRLSAELAIGEEPLVIEEIALGILIARGMLEGEVLEVSAEEASRAISVK